MTPSSRSSRSYDDLLAERINWHLADKDALKKIASAQAEREYYDPMNPTVTEFIAQDPDPTPWRIEGLHKLGSNCTITAQYKTGKSTLMLNLIHSLADGVPFLGEFPVVAPEGNIEYWNMELSESMCRDWIRDTRIKNTDRVRVTNLRGQRQPLYSEWVQDQVVERLKRNEIECWIIDPAARIMSGWPGFPDPENSNACVTEVTEVLDDIKQRSGVVDLWLPMHTGREGANRSRGATRWDDWTDIRFVLYADPTIDPGNPVRVLRTDGRDVERYERPLSYDPERRQLKIEKDVDGMRLAGAARAAVSAANKSNFTKVADLRKAMTGVATEMKDPAIEQARAWGWLDGLTVNIEHPDVLEMLG